MSAPLIWGLDTATRLTGWCVGTGEARPACGVWSYEHVGSDLGLLAELFDRDLCALVERFGEPQVICYEAPILKPHDRLATLRKLLGLGFYLEGWARKRKIFICEEGAKAIKKRIAGNASATKDQMVAIVRGKLGITLPQGPGEKDAADAFGAWLTGGVDHYARQFQPRWDGMLYGSRGGLL